MWYSYCRKSTEKQNETSFQVQEEYLNRQAEKLGQTEIQVIHETGSGSSIEGRPLFQKLLTDSQKGDIIGLYDSSRGFRNTEDALRVASVLSLKGVRLYISDKFIDIDRPVDKMFWTIASGFDTYQREIQADKAKQGIKKVYDSGDYIFCSTLFGYQLNRKSVSVIEEEAKVIQFIFEKFSSGWSVKKLLSNLTGVVLPRQSSFTLKKISRILHNTIYMGYYPKNKDKLDNPGLMSRSELESILIKSNIYPPIISEDLFWSCFERYRTIVPTHSRPFQLRWTKHTLSGIIRCPSCKNGIAHFTKMGDVYCTEDHSPTCETKFRTKFDSRWLETIMEFCFYLTFLSGDEIGSFFSERQQELYQNKTELTEVLSDIDKSISDTETKIGRIVSAIADGVISNAQASAQMHTLKQTISDLQLRKTSLEQDLRQIEVDVDSLIELSSSEVIDSFYNNKRDYFKKFLKYGYAYKDRIEIEYMNGKHYTIPRGYRHNHKVDPVTIVSSYNNDVYSFVYEVNKVVYNPCGVEAYDHYIESLLNKSWNLVTSV